MSGIIDQVPQRLIDEAQETSRRRGFNEKAAAAYTDYLVHHRDGYSHSPIGILDDDGRVRCVGCRWCEGDRTFAHTYVEAQRQRREQLDQAGDDRVRGLTQAVMAELRRAREDGFRAALVHAGYTPGSIDQAVEEYRDWIEEV